MSTTDIDDGQAEFVAASSLFDRDPWQVEAIEAEYVWTIYQATRLARRQLLGLTPVGEPPQAAHELLRRVQGHPGILPLLRPA